MKTKQILLSFLFLSFLFANLFGQEKKDPYVSLTSETKYEDEYPFKTRVISFGISAQHDIILKDSPTAFFLYSGYEFRKYYEEYNVYWGLGPRMRIGWMTGDDVLYAVEQDYDFSFNSFSWGASIVPTIGLILSADDYIGIYLEGELGVLNYHTRAKITPLEQGSTKNRNDYLKLNLALRAGFRGNFSSKLEGSVWVGLSNVNSKDAIGKIRFDNRSIEKFSLFGEVGFGISF